MDDSLEQRIDALERAVTDGNHDLSRLADEADALDRLADAESRLEELEAATDELEAATQALRGYVGNIRSVNRDVEQRANAALAKAESVEQAVTEANETTAAAGEAVSAGTNGCSGTYESGSKNTDADHRSTATQRTNQSRQKEPEPDAVAPSDGPTSELHAGATPDGGLQNGHADHCHMCGRPRETQQAIDTRRETVNGPRGAADPSSERTDELVETSSEDAGTLGRIREML